MDQVFLWSVDGNQNGDTMCGRFTLKTPTATIGSLFPGLVIPDLAPRYNVAPTQNIACVRQGKIGKNELALLRWGLIPFWAKDTRIGAKMINARAETVAEKPSFRNAFKKRRCLVFADGYYEWIKENGGKQPYYITLPDSAPQPLSGPRPAGDIERRAE